jgi:plasmid maintenance system antidote protein VapI
MMDVNQQVDDQGTNQSEALQMLKSLRDDAFDSSNEKLALALGRPAEDIESWINGTDVIDDDVAMKMRGIAQKLA